jgi:N,N'-diacetylchitobiose transport system substrate-binding protein
MRRLAALLAGPLLMAAACGDGGDGRGAAGGEAAAERGAIDVWIMEPGAPELKTFFEQATADFERAHPGAEVEVQFVPWASAHDQFVTAIGGGQVPDVAEMGSTWTPEFGDVGALLPAEGDLDGFVESLVEGATVDDEVYGLPWYAGARSLIYRSDVLAQLGLSPPDTWDELLAVGRALRDRTDEFSCRPGQGCPFGVAGDANHYFLPMVWQNGGEIARKKDGRWVSGMDSPEAVGAVQFYADLYAKERFAPEGALSWNSRDVRAAFEAGDLAMMIGGGWDLRAILAAHPELAGKVATALLPAGPSGSRDTFAGGSHLVVFEGTEHEVLARSYAEFLLDPRRVGAFADKIGFLPGGLEALEAVSAGGDALYRIFAAQLHDHSRTYPPTTQWGSFEADKLFVNAVQQIMKGERSAKEAMAGVAEAMNEAFDQ